MTRRLMPLLAAVGLLVPRCTSRTQSAGKTGARQGFPTIYTVAIAVDHRDWMRRE
jgi:hypothetical protein